MATIFSPEDHQAMRAGVESLAFAALGVEHMVASVASSSLSVGQCPECRRATCEPARTGSGYCSSGLHFDW